MRSLIVVALSLTVVAVAGCSGSDDADPTTTSGTAAPVTTPAPSATESTSTTPTTTAATSAPPTTEAPTTTLDPTAALIADIEADLNAGEQAFLAAGADPGNPELRAEVERYHGEDSLRVVTEFLDSLESDGLLVRPTPGVPSVLEVVSLDPVATPLDEGARIDAVLCRVDAGVVYEPLGGGAEAIVNDAIATTISNSTLQQVNEIWVLMGGTTIEEQPGQTSCDE